jgi:glutathione S-transferase
MIELYTWSTPNGRKVSIMLEECGADQAEEDRCPDTLYYLQVLVFSASMRWASFRRLGFFRRP